MPKSSQGLIFVLTSCVHFALRKSIVMASCQIVTSSLLLRMIIGHLSTHGDNTKETRSCPIVLRWKHDYVRHSQYRRVAIVYRTMVWRWGHCDGEDSHTLVDIMLVACIMEQPNLSSPCLSHVLWNLGHIKNKSLSILFRQSLATLRGRGLCNPYSTLNIHQI